MFTNNADIILDEFDRHFNSSLHHTDNELTELLNLDLLLTYQLLATSNDYENKLDINKLVDSSKKSLGVKNT